MRLNAQMHIGVQHCTKVLREFSEDGRDKTVLSRDNDVAGYRLNTKAKIYQ